MLIALLIRDRRRRLGHGDALAYIASTWPRTDAGHFAEMILTGNQAGVVRHYPDFLAPSRTHREDDHG